MFLIESRLYQIFHRNNRIHISLSLTFFLYSCIFFRQYPVTIFPPQFATFHNQNNNLFSRLVGVSLLHDHDWNWNETQVFRVEGNCFGPWTPKGAAHGPWCTVQLSPGRSWRTDPLRKQEDEKECGTSSKLNPKAEIFSRTFLVDYFIWRITKTVSPSGILARLLSLHGF